MPRKTLCQLLRKAASLNLMTLLLLSLTGCCGVEKKWHYTPPEPLGIIPRHERIVHASFDETWATLIDSIGRSFFAIEEFEKESGLLTLSFTKSPFSTAVDGGQCELLYDNSSAVATQTVLLGHCSTPITKIKFKGNYADFLENFHNGIFEGRMNLVVREIDENRTRITMNTRFVVSARTAGPSPRNALSFSWNSGDRCKKMATDINGNRSPRIFQSAYTVETRALDAIEKMFALNRSKKIGTSRATPD